MVFLVPPSTRIPLPPLGDFSVLFIVFPLLFILFFGIGTLLFKTRLNGLLLSLFVISFLLLRMFDLHHPIFFVILAAFFIAVEFFFFQSGSKSTRKKEPEEEK